MKKFFYLALALCMGFAVTSCNDDDDDEFVSLEVQQEFQMTADQLTVMEGVEYVLAPTYTGADEKTTWKWEIDGETVGTEPELHYTFVEAGEYMVFLTATNSHNSGVAFTYHVTVKPWMLDFEGSYWDALIDNPQYNGTLLYGENAVNYKWADEKTSLTGGLTLAWGGAYGFAEGGTAISNYIDANIQEHATYEYQLAVPVSNGSKNFAVVYCGATVKFPVDVKRVIKSMDIAPTTYLLGVMKNGDGGYAKALTEDGDFLTLVITADNGKALDVDMARDGAILETWKTFDLSSLGEVNSLTFSMKGSDASNYGPKQPTYFAFDNVVVKMN